MRASQPHFPLATSTTALLALGVALAGCNKDEDSADPGRGDCNPVGGGTHCLLPFPSSYFLTEDSSTGSGFRVDFGPESLPINNEDMRTDPAYWNELDGFPILGSMYTHFPDVAVDGVVGHQDLDAYLEDDVKTVILNAETGERVPHFVELEVQVLDDSRSLLMLRPVKAMEHATRYVVGMRGLIDGSGGTLDARPGFSELRDGSDSADADVERQREHYDSDIFPVLEQAGFARSELQLAWDFVTVSAETNLGRMLLIRDDALERVGDAGPSTSFTLLDEADCSVKGTETGRTLEGTMSVPLYLTDWEPGSFLTRDEQGMPYYNGEVEVDFTVRIPCSLLEDPRPGTLVQYGHGLLGDQSEVYTGYLSEMANAYGWVGFCTDWTGMKFHDVGVIMSEINGGMSGFATLPERLHQGFLEHLMAGRVMLGDGAQDPLLMQDGVSLVDTSALHFYGNSQGSILGGGYVAMSPDIERAVFGVGGTPYSLLLTRSHDFELYFMMLRAKYDDDMDISLLIALMQMLWDPGESAGWAHYMNELSLDGVTPAKQTLIQVGIADAQVPTLGAHVQARSWGASLVEPASRAVWGLEERTPPFEGSALVEFDYGYEEPEECVPSEEKTDTHEGPRREEAGQAQIRDFLEEGTVAHYCDGACDPD